MLDLIVRVGFIFLRFLFLFRNEEYFAPSQHEADEEDEDGDLPLAAVEPIDESEHQGKLLTGWIYYPFHCCCLLEKETIQKHKQVGLSWFSMQLIKWEINSTS